MKWDIKEPFVEGLQNQDRARTLAKFCKGLHVRSVKNCPNCRKRPITMHLDMGTLRCDPCGNELINLWNEIRSNLDGNDS